MNYCTQCGKKVRKNEDRCVCGFKYDEYGKSTSILYDKISSLDNITFWLRVILLIGLIFSIYGFVELYNIDLKLPPLIYGTLPFSVISCLLMFSFYNRLSSVLFEINESFKNKNN